MLAHVLGSLCLRVLRSPVLGRAVRAAIVLGTRDAMPRGTDAPVAALVPAR